MKNAKMTMEDEMTEYPETECEADDGPQPMGGLFSGKGAAKGNDVVLIQIIYENLSLFWWLVKICFNKKKIKYF